MSGKDMQALAEARLGPLVREGIGEVVGVSRADGREKVFIALNKDVDEKDPAYQAKMEIIRARLKATLKEIPFSILGHYDDLQGEQAPHFSGHSSVASVQFAHPAPLPPPANAYAGHTSENPRSHDNHRQADYGNIDAHQLHERVHRLETRVTGLPSRSFVVGMLVLNLSLFALALLFQKRLLALFEEVLPSLQNTVQNFMSAF